MFFVNRLHLFRRIVDTILLALNNLYDNVDASMTLINQWMSDCVTMRLRNDAFASHVVDL